MRLPKTSLIAQQLSLPSPVGCSVMLVSETRFGALAAKMCWTGSSKTGGTAYLPFPRRRHWAADRSP